MAKTKRKTTTTPAHRFLRLDLEHNSSVANDFGYYEDFHYIDLASLLSSINSRLYRQGMMYHVANISVHDRQGGWVKFCTLPNTWPVRQAWRKGFQKWLQMNYESMDADTLKATAQNARWSDYRVFFSASHATDTADRPPFVDVEGKAANQDELTYTKYTSTDGGTPDEFTAHMMGGHTGSAGSYSSISLLEAYIETLNKPQAPDANVSMAVGVWANLLESETGSDDIIVDLRDDYDEPPYDHDCFPGGNKGSLVNAPNPWSVRETDFIAPNRHQIVGGFEVPLGLICVETSREVSGDNTIGLIIELVPGPYKGIMAESMGTPKLVNQKEWKVS